MKSFEFVLEKHCSETFSFDAGIEFSRYRVFIIGENPQK